MRAPIRRSARRINGDRVAPASEQRGCNRANGFVSHAAHHADAFASIDPHLHDFEVGRALDFQVLQVGQHLRSDFGGRGFVGPRRLGRIQIRQADANAAHQDQYRYRNDKPGLQFLRRRPVGKVKGVGVFPFPLPS